MLMKSWFPVLVSLQIVTAACSGDSLDPEDPGADDQTPEGPADGDPNGSGGGSDGPTADGVPVAINTATATSPATCDTAVEVYQATTNGALGVVAFDDPGDGGAGSSTFSNVGTGWNASRILVNGHRVIYTITDDGKLHWYRRVSGSTYATGAGKELGSGWAGFKSVVSGGDGILYALTTGGDLKWYRHADPYGGAVSFATGQGKVIATGWNDQRLVGGGDGVIYAIDADGNLRWYRHTDPFGGAATWAANGGTIVGTNWNAAVNVTSAGGGVLYATLADGTALWFRHLDATGGAASWEAAAGVAVVDGLAVPSRTWSQLSACYRGAAVPVPHRAQLKYGLHPDASDALRAAGVTADRITQTIGNAAASAGTHAQDGTADGLAYGAATDLSVRGMTEAQIKTLIEKLGTLGFAAWYRKPGFDGWPSSEVAHIHIVWAAAPMKSLLRSQIRDFVVGKNGLASHTTYSFYKWSEFALRRVRKEFLATNPGLN